MEEINKQKIMLLNYDDKNESTNFNFGPILSKIKDIKPLFIICCTKKNVEKSSLITKIFGHLNSGNHFLHRFQSNLPKNYNLCCDGYTKYKLVYKKYVLRMRIYINIDSIEQSETISNRQIGIAFGPNTKKKVYLKLISVINYVYIL